MGVLTVTVDTLCGPASNVLCLQCKTGGEALKSHSDTELARRVWLWVKWGSQQIYRVVL